MAFSLCSAVKSFFKCLAILALLPLLGSCTKETRESVFPTEHWQHVNQSYMDYKKGSLSRAFAISHWRASERQSFDRNGFPDDTWVAGWEDNKDSCRAAVEGALQRCLGVTRTTAHRNSNPRKNEKYAGCIIIDVSCETEEEYAELFLHQMD